MNVDQIKPDRL